MNKLSFEKFAELSKKLTKKKKKRYRLHSVMTTDPLDYHHHFPLSIEKCELWIRNKELKTHGNVKVAIHPFEYFFFQAQGSCQAYTPYFAITVDRHILKPRNL